MKYFFNIKLGTQPTENGLTVFTNRHSFILKTAMFGESIDTVWTSLGSFRNGIAIFDGLKNIEVDIPEVKQSIETNFENKIKPGFSIGKASFKTIEFYTLAKYDGSELSVLDDKTLAEMDSNIEEG